MHTRKRQTSCLMMILLTVCLCGCAKKQPDQVLLSPAVEEDTKTEQKTKETEEGQPDFYVYVCGQVANPGVYQLPEGSRVFAAIDAAGGLLETADPNGINQADKTSDGQQIYVPSKEEAADVKGAAPGQEESDSRVNLNTADVSKLMTLPGIGEAKAQSIIRYREEQGRFQSTEDIMNVQGIKEGVYEKIKEQIKI